MSAIKKRKAEGGKGGEKRRNGKSENGSQRRVACRESNIPCTFSPALTFVRRYQT